MQEKGEEFGAECKSWCKNGKYKSADIRAFHLLNV